MDNVTISSMVHECVDPPIVITDANGRIGLLLVRRWPSATAIDLPTDDRAYPPIFRPALCSWP